MSEFTRRGLIGATAVAAATASVSAIAKTKRPYRRIACEEAFIIPEVREALSKAAGGKPSMRSGPIAGPFMKDLLDLGEGRIAKMTAAGIDMAVLSHTSPGTQTFEPQQGLDLARLANDRLAEAIRRHPDRFAGLATITPQAPEETARELERAVSRLGFKGGIINSSTQNVYLDERRFRPIFEAAQALDVPIYIHPREPSTSMGRPLSRPASPSPGAMASRRAPTPFDSSHPGSSMICHVCALFSAT